MGRMARLNALRRSQSLEVEQSAPLELASSSISLPAGAKPGTRIMIVADNGSITRNLRAVAIMSAVISECGSFPGIPVPTFFRPKPPTIKDAIRPNRRRM